MIGRKTTVPMLAVGLLMLVGGCSANSEADKADALAKSIKRGEYLVRVGACNDCHTPGYLMSEGKTPVKEWLVGDSLGWSGPWGTTYAQNLRLRFQDFSSAKEWIEYSHAMRPLPPMAWFNVNAMTDEDLTAIYDFIRWLGPAGKQPPQFVPVSETPAGPVVQFPMGPPQAKAE